MIPWAGKRRELFPLQPEGLGREWLSAPERMAKLRRSPLWNCGFREGS